MSGSYYNDAMSELTDKYNSYIAQAQNTARRKKCPSVEEYQLYMEAAQTAQEISQLNASKVSVKQQWENRAVSNQKSAIEIYKKLHPPTVQPVVPSDNPPAVPAVNKSAAPTVNKPAAAPQNTNKQQAAGTYVTTASGFTTKNANADVTADMIEKWYQKEKPNHSLDDVVGMEEMKRIIREELLDNIGWNKTDAYLKIPNLKSFLLYGPFGTGKSYFIEAVARDLMDKGFKFIKLSGSDVHDSFVGVGEKVVRAAFQEAVDNAPCILYMDEFENMCSDRADSKEGHEKRLSVAFMESYNILVGCDKPVIFLAATNYPDKIEKAMISRIMTFVKVPLPSEEVRVNYFQKKLQSLIHFGEDVDAEYMADATDNYCFRDLDKIAVKSYQRIKRQAIEKFAVHDEDGHVKQCEESDEKVVEAIANGSVFITKDLFDEILSDCPPEKKEDILASIKAFENKK